jgi:hypothetical protein
VSDETAPDTIKFELDVNQTGMTKEQALRLAEMLKCFLVCASPVSVPSGQCIVRSPISNH